jgi:hypothetical protein
MLGVVVYAYNPSNLGGGDRRITVHGWPGQKQNTLFEKQTKNKRTRDVDQLVESLPRQWKVLSSNSSVAKEGTA